MIIVDGKVSFENCLKILNKINIAKQKANKEFTADDLFKALTPRVRRIVGPWGLDEKKQIYVILHQCQIPEDDIEKQVNLSAVIGTFRSVLEQEIPNLSEAVKCRDKLLLNIARFIKNCSDPSTEEIKSRFIALQAQIKAEPAFNLQRIVSENPILKNLPELEGFNPKLVDELKQLDAATQTLKEFITYLTRL